MGHRLIHGLIDGGGYSESRENRKRDRREHGQITSVYMGKGELFKYKAVIRGRRKVHMHKLCPRPSLTTECWSGLLPI